MMSKLLYHRGRDRDRVAAEQVGLQVVEHGVPDRTVGREVDLEITGLKPQIGHNIGLQAHIGMR